MSYTHTYTIDFTNPLTHTAFDILFTPGANTTLSDAQLTLSMDANYAYYSSDRALDIWLDGTSLGRLLNNDPTDDIFGHPNDNGDYWFTLTFDAVIPVADMQTYLADGDLLFTFLDTPTIDYFFSISMRFELTLELPVLA